ncbi:unnamed protein product [Mucor hiemalis]
MSNSMSSPTAAYLTWLRANGAHFEKLEFKDDGEGVGCVYATTEIEENESFVTIPFRFCITEKLAREELPGLEEFSARTVLSFYLLLQKRLGEKSFYAPYINIFLKRSKQLCFLNKMISSTLPTQTWSRLPKREKLLYYQNLNVH